MKKLALFITAILLTAVINAQLKMPQPSPGAEMEQEVGLTDITVQYSRPSMKGRTIFGDLVPFDKLWRTGANKNTMITFSDAVKVGGKELKAGTYSIFTKPGKDSWEVIFYTDTENWGTPEKWDDSKVGAKIMVKPMAIDMKIETFTIAFSDFTNESAKLSILWENTEVDVLIEVPTKEKAMANIEKTMSGPSARDYYQAAVFYKDAKDFKKAKEHIEKAVSKSEKPEFWMLRQHSLILAGLGDKAGAIKAAKTSLELSQKAKNDDYVKMNKDSLKEWGA